jgi:mannose-1-phosphate guanylyltransferase
MFGGMKGMLLAAGLGTRLAPLSHERPKPAMPFRLRTLGGEGLREMARAGVRDIVVNAHPLPEVLEQAFIEDAPPEARLTFSIEDEVLGTAGGIHKAYGASPEPLVVMNGDLLYAPDLGRAIAAHEEQAPLATLLVRHVDGSAPGTIDVDTEGRIRAILDENPPAPGLSRLAFTGVHILSPEALTMLPRVGCVIRDAYVPWLCAGARLMALVDDAPFSDLGTPRVYFDAHFGPGHEREPQVSLEARVEEGARVDDSYVGAHACVPRGARLTRSIVWPSAEVPPGDHEGVVITPRGVYRP